MTDRGSIPVIFQAISRRLPVLAVLAVLWPLAIHPGQAQTPAVGGNVYEIRNIDVDVTAATAAQARTKALAEGERRAFRVLLERLTLLKDAPRLPKLKSSQIASLVQDFSVDDEKTSAVRYLARLNFRFKSRDVRDLLVNWGLPFAETPSKPVLVLAVYQNIGALSLWDTPNPWRAAWGKLGAASGLVPLVLPIGDLADIRVIGPEQAVDGDAVRLRAISARYKTDDAIVAYAKRNINTATGRPEIEVFVTRYGTEQVEQTVVRKYGVEVGETNENHLVRAAAHLTRLIDDAWKQDNLLQFSRPAVAVVNIPIRRLDDWLQIRKRLSSVAVVRRADLVLLSRDQARVNLHYIGDPDQLALALKQADLSLIREAGEWILAPARPS